MRRAWIAGLLALTIVMSQSDDAHAFNGCDESCAVIAYAIITAGGIGTAIGSQVSLLEGEPDRDLGAVTLGLAGANAISSVVILLFAGVRAAMDEDDATGFAAWGGIQMGLALVALVSGAHVMANTEAPGDRPPPKLSGASLKVAF